MGCILVIFLDICSVLGSQALETPQPIFRELMEPDWAWLLQPSPEPSPETCWIWPGSAPKPPGAFSGILSGTFSGTFSRTSLNLTLALHQSLPEPCPEPSSPSPEPFREPVEPDLALHQSLPDLLWNLLQNILRKPVSQTFSGTSLNLTRRLHQCTPELFWAEDPLSLRCWGIKQ